MKKKLLFLLLLSGIIFRVIFPKNFGVGFDQIQIIEKANQILNNDFSLIGPRTGPANMFTGPLIYYLTVPFIFVFGDFSSIFLVPLLISLVTGLVLYRVTKHYLGYKESLAATAIWAFSPFLVTLDRVFWNPNITLLSAFLLFIPLLKNKSNKLTLFLLFIGSFLSYQSHFSGFFLIALSILSIILFKKSIKLIAPIILGIVLSILPTVLFDFRNNFLNFKGAISLVSDKGEFNFSALISDIFHNAYILIETYGKLFFYGNSTQTIISTGIVLVLLSVFVKKYSQVLKLSFLWLGSIALAYSFYNGEKPEYYFLIAVPALIFLFIDLIGHIQPKYQKLILVFFLANSLFVNINNSKPGVGMTVGNISNVKSSLESKDVKSISYDVPFGAEVGMKYFLADVPLIDDGDVYHISYPNDLTFNGIQQFSNIGIWKDMRESDKNYISTKGYFLETSKNYSLLKDLYPKTGLQDFDKYKIIENNVVIGTLDIAKEEKNQLDWVQICLEGKPLKNSDWIIDDKNNFYRLGASHCIKIEPRAGYQVDVDSINIW